MSGLLDRLLDDPFSWKWWLLPAFTWKRVVLAFLVSRHYGGIWACDLGPQGIGYTERTQWVKARVSDGADFGLVQRLAADNQPLPPTDHRVVRLQALLDYLTKNLGLPYSTAYLLPETDLRKFVARSLPGEVAPSIGCLDHCASADELMAILCHELAHHYANHVTEELVLRIVCMTLW